MFFFVLYSFILIQSTLTSHIFLAAEKPSLRSKNELIRLVDHYKTMPHRTSFEKLNNIAEEVSQQFDSDLQTKPLLKSIDRTRIDLSLLLLSDEKQEPNINTCITAVNCLGTIVQLYQKKPCNKTLSYLTQEIRVINLPAVHCLQNNPTFEEKTFFSQLLLEKYNHSFCSGIKQEVIASQHMIKQYLKKCFEPTETEVAQWENTIQRFVALCGPGARENNAVLIELLHELKDYHAEKIKEKTDLTLFIKSTFIDPTIISLIEHFNPYSAQRFENLTLFINNSIERYYPQPSDQKTAVLQLYQQACTNYKEALRLKNHFLVTYSKAINILEKPDRYSYDQQEVSKIVLSVAEDANTLSLFNDIAERFKQWKTKNTGQEG